MPAVPRVVLALAALVAAGEAVALAFGLRWRQPDHPSVGAKNDLLLALDIVGGAALLIAVGIDAPRPWLITLVALLVASHGWRTIEPLAPVESIFAANTGLAIVNVLELLLSGAGLWLLVRGD